MSTFMYKNEQIGGLKPKTEDVGIGESDISSAFGLTPPIFSFLQIKVDI